MALDETKPSGDDLVSSLDTYIQEDRVAINLNTTHRGGDGTDHTYIDQDVTSGASPTFDGTNFSGVPDSALSSGATVTSAGAGDSGKLVKLDASGALDSSVIGASFETTDLGVTGLTVSQLLRVNSGGTAIESSGKTVPTGDIVGTSDSQTLTNKTLTTPTVGDFTNAPHDHSNAAGGGTISMSDITGDVETTDLGVTSLTVSQLLRVNSGGTAIESSGKTVPVGDLVGTSDPQVLTGKTLTSPIITTMKIDDGDAYCTLTSADQTNASATVTVPNIGDAADTFVMNDTAATLTNKTMDAGTFTGVQGLANASAPGGAKTDGVYIWSQDIVAGNAAPHFYTEEGQIVKLYQNRSADQATITPTTTGSNTGTSGAGLSLIGDTTSVNQASNIMNDLVALKEDITALNTLVNSIRTALINCNIIKGSA